MFVGIVDSSGFRFHYTEDVRKYDASVLVTGAGVTRDMAIPPGQSNWNTNGYCSGACTKEVNNNNNNNNNNNENENENVDVDDDDDDDDDDNDDDDEMQLCLQFSLSSL